MLPAQTLLLARRNACALVAAGVTMFSAGAALPGHASAVLLLAGPVLALGAAIPVVRAHRLARRLQGSRGLTVRPPLEDLGHLLGLRLPATAPGRLLLVATALATAAAFVRDRGEHATVGHALLTCGIEGIAVVACFVALGPVLGLRRR